MQKIDFIADVLNPILDEDPMAVLVPIGGQALTHTENTTQVMVSNTMVGGVDFMPTDSPKNIASKLFRVCLAELSAKGAVARSCSLMLCLTETAVKQLAPKVRTLFPCLALVSLLGSLCRLQGLFLATWYVCRVKWVCQLWVDISVRVRILAFWTIRMIVSLMPIKGQNLIGHWARS